MRRLLVSITVALLAVPGVASAAEPEAGTLHSCATSVAGNAASGRCYGTGAFRLVASCDDGRTVDSSWLRIIHGMGATKVRCRSKAVDAWIEQA